MQFSTYRYVLASLAILAVSQSSAKSPSHPSISHGIRLACSASALKKFPHVQSTPETLHVLAAMVDFQPDNDSRTTGTGSFDLSAATTQSLDPSPHDANYFRDHLTFVENYFRRVSDGRLVIQGVVLDSVYTLLHQMQYYSPPKSSQSNMELGLLMEDTWKMIDSVTPGIQFQNYQSFVIFHAGAGRDVDLSSICVVDPTPFDIPSLFLDPAGLQKMFGANYPGVLVNGGSDTIRNSIILPETENRNLQTVCGSNLPPLAMNGLFAASIGSYLGLPDLFNTRSGLSGIGRFGLMDGQSIFSWYGVFPPEPSAWEKYFLGWLSPITVNSSDSVYRLPAVSLTTSNDTVYRVLLSEKEYFLVENRNRDANRDGAIVTIARNGTTVTKSWARDTTGFEFFDQDSLYGVVVNVDDFEWSLPGGVDATTGEWFDGGILIWHIDENVIDANYETNTVNADSTHRGVSLMEADGSQDIGQVYAPFTDAGYGSEAGTPLDFWFAGNSAPLRMRSNAFTPTSHPSSASNDGANSHVTMTTFSVRSPRMTAEIQIGDAQVSPLPGFPKYTGHEAGRNSVTAGDYSSGASAPLLLCTDRSVPSGAATPQGVPPGQIDQSRIYGWKTDGSQLVAGGDASGLLTSALGVHGSLFGKPVYEDSTVIVGELKTDQVSPAAGQFVPLAAAWSTKGLDVYHRIDSLFALPLARTITSSPAVSDSFIAFGAAHGMLYILRNDGSLKESLQVSLSDTSPVVQVGLYQNPDLFVAVTANGTLFISGLVCASQPLVLTPADFRFKPSYAVAGILSPTGGRQVVVCSADGMVSVIGPCGLTGPGSSKGGFPFSTGGQIAGPPALADIDGDGRREIVVVSGNTLWAINAAGGVLDNFPILLPTGKTVLASPIVADVNGDGNADIVTVTQEGLVLAYDKTGRMLPGYPLLAGINAGSTPAAFYVPSSCLSCTDIGIAVASDDGFVYAWRTGRIQTGIAAPPPFGWPQLMHDGRNSALADSVLTPVSVSNGYFPSSRAYNWPNPVNAAHGYKTHIRYFVRDDSKVHIKIFDLAGDAVTEFDGPGQGGFDNEVEWDVSRIQSGIYFAHVEAQAPGGHGIAIIKIAVVK